MWHNITPKEFYAMESGEQTLLFAFIAYEIEYRYGREKMWAEFFVKLFGG